MNVEIRVVTNAKKREARLEGTVLKVKLTALPRDGKANEELIEFLSDLFGVRRSEISIMRGERDRRKVVSLPLDETTMRAVVEKRQELQ